MEYVHDRLFINYSCKWWELIRCDLVLILVPLWSQVYFCLLHINDNIYSSFFKTPHVQKEKILDHLMWTRKRTKQMKHKNGCIQNWGNEKNAMAVIWQIWDSGNSFSLACMREERRDPMKEGSEEKVGLGFRGGTWATVNEWLVDVGGQESWVGVPVHQCVDLKLGIFKRVRRRVLHLSVDHLSNPGIQTYLQGKVNVSMLNLFVFRINDQ